MIEYPERSHVIKRLGTIRGLRDRGIRDRVSRARINRARVYKDRVIRVVFIVNRVT